MITRTQRQKTCVKNWINTKGRATVVAATGFGKTRVAIITIKHLLKVNPDAQILISVPTDVLKKQWVKELVEFNLLSNCCVEIINTIVKNDHTVDLLICDEVHLTPTNTFQKIFTSVDYTYFLGLTGTLERLDGKEFLIEQYAPVCDRITMKEALENGWVSPIREYAVMIDADLSEYNEWNRKFNGSFSFFNYVFEDAMSCATNAIFRNKYAKKMGYDPKQVAATAMLWMQCLQKRKKFVMSHPKKIEVARRILNARQDKKCITFSATIKDAEKLAIKGECVLHSKKSKKQNNATIEAFNKYSSGVLHSSKAADCGVDIKGLSVGIILSTDSSKIRKNQRNGRVCRMEEGKEAEIFTLLIRGTQEVNWHRNSAGSNYITINESQLGDVLSGKIVETRQQENITNTKYRF